jgi:hypothetical protein
VDLHDLPEPRPGAVREDDYDPHGDPIPPPGSDPPSCLDHHPEPEPPCLGLEPRPGQPTTPDQDIPF